MDAEQGSQPARTDAGLAAYPAAKLRGGMEKGKAEVALGMLKEGMSIEVVSRITGLSEEEIERLR